MEFPERLIAIRKKRGLTQQALADSVELTPLQIRRYEGGTSQPTLDAIRRLANVLGVSADALVFGDKERGPDDSWRYELEAVSRLPAHEQAAARLVLDALIARHGAERAKPRAKSRKKTS